MIVLFAFPNRETNELDDTRWYKTAFVSSKEEAREDVIRRNVSMHMMQMATAVFIKVPGGLITEKNRISGNTKYYGKNNAITEYSNHLGFTSIEEICKAENIPLKF